MTSALPQRIFTADYERMVEEEEKASVKSLTALTAAEYLSLCCAGDAPQGDAFWCCRKASRHR